MTLVARVIKAIERNPGGLTAAQVADLLDCDKSTVAGYCNRLLLKQQIHVAAWRRTSARGPLASVYRFGPRPGNLRIAPPPEAIRRERRIITTLTPDEHRQIFAAAKAKGMHAATFMRALALQNSGVANA